MSEKKENIVGAALKLFAEEGYDAISTNKVAKAADVSEGLIFKHFENKDGLLKAVMNEGYKNTRIFLADVVLENDPKEIIRKAIELPFTIMENNGDFMRLQHRMKWQGEYGNPMQSDSVQLIVGNALKKIGFPNPEMESKVLTYLIEGISGSLSAGALPDGNDLLAFVKQKYGV